MPSLLPGVCRVSGRNLKPTKGRNFERGSSRLSFKKIIDVLLYPFSIPKQVRFSLRLFAITLISLNIILRENFCLISKEPGALMAAKMLSPLLSEHTHNLLQYVCRQKRARSNKLRNKLQLLEERTGRIRDYLKSIIFTSSE